MNPDSYYDGSGYDRETVAFYDVAHEARRSAPSPGPSTRCRGCTG